MSVEFTESTPAPPPAPTGAWSAVFERDVPIPMRDGVRLMADIWRPDAPGRFPVLLRRTPYDKGHMLGHADTGLDPVDAVERGYVVIAQDARGRYRSEGEFRPFADERLDGFDTVEWAARQSWSTGQVATFGQSYVGFTQLAAAASAPPHLVGIAPDVAAGDPYQIFYRGGALNLAVALCWSAFDIAPAALMRDRELGSATVAAGLARIAAAAADLGASYRHLPVGGEAWVQELVPLFSEWLEHPTRDAYWQARSADLSAIAVPALHIGGWYDVALEQTLAAYETLRTSAPTERAREGQRLIIGPWAHDGATRRKLSLGDLDFGLEGNRLPFDLSSVLLDWFDDLMHARDGAGPPVRLFVMGINRWREEDQWPLTRATPLTLFLHSRGGANSARGDGVLSLEPPADDEFADTYVSDPRNPLPYRGGALLECPGLEAGPLDQRPLEERSDVVVYTSAPLLEDLEVTGPLAITLFISSSVVDTDFTVKLCDVHADGRSFNLADGILRARHRDGFDRLRLLEPGQPTELQIGLGATSNVFRAGHRLRVQVSSSDFPRYARHSNTDRPEGEATEADLEPALQRVHHTTALPSRITLPIVGPPPRFS